MSRAERRGMIQPDHPHLSLLRQCGLLGISRSSAYYRPVEPDAYDLELMGLIDRQYPVTSF